MGHQHEGRDHGTKARQLVERAAAMAGLDDWRADPGDDEDPFAVLDAMDREGLS